MQITVQWEVKVNKLSFLPKKPEALENAQAQISEKWNALQPRERVMLAILPFALILIFGGFIFYKVNQNIDKQVTETEKYREALTYIADNQLQYQKNKAKKEAMRQKLIDADAKIVSKLTNMASNLGFDVTVTPKDPKKVSDDSGVEEQEIEVTLKNVDYSKFLEYIIQIHQLETPIYMRHLNMTRTSNNSTSDTKMTVSITLMSYRLKEPNAA